MSKFAKLAIVGATYALVVFGLLFSALRQVTGSTDYNIMEATGTGIFIMYGLAILGLGVVVGVIVFAIAKEPSSH